MKLKLKNICCLLLLIAWFSTNAQPEDLSASSKKISPNLLRYLELRKQNNNTNTHHDVYKLVCNNVNELSAAYQEAGISPVIKQYFPAYQVFVLEINDNLLLQKLLKLPSVIYADLYHPPKEELEVGNFDPSLNRINVLHQKYPLSDGTGLAVSIKENIFDTLDIDFKGRYISSGNASAVSTTHASIMATLVGGGGNTSEGSLGVAPGTRLSSSNFVNLLPDATTLFQQLNISAQNHSYGTSSEHFYGAEARAYDQQLNAMPGFAHVFSAGNSGTSAATTGLYSGLTGVANMTGNFKSAKNVIDVAATDSFSHVPAAISKGPAYDGRLKPEITAFGEDGSSGAAAIVTGTIISLQHLYQQLYGSLPATALLRAVLFNSADDIGPAGIDFSSGYGSLNAMKAADNISNGRFFSGSITQSAVQVFTVAIPPGIKKAKFTVAWNDPAAAMLAAKALVNDADLLVVRLSDNLPYMPWVLNHFPHLDSLRQLPQRKKDTLNNAEQVSIDDPLPGNYEIRIYGSSIASGSQPFYIAYQLDPVSYFEFTQPVKNDHFLAGNPNTIRWQHTLTGTGTLQYSLDNITWNTITSNADLSAGYYVWNAPDTMSTARVRMLGSVNNTSDSFVISTPPLLQIGFNCDDDFMLWWNKTKNTGSYELLRLGPKYMELFTSQPDTFRIYTKISQPALHYAVRPVLLNGAPAQRSATYNYTTQGVGCYFISFLAELSGSHADITLQLGAINGIQSITLEKQSGNGFITLQQVTNIGQLIYLFTDNALKTGLNVYRVRITRSNGQLAYSNLATVYYFGKQPYLVYPNPIPFNGVFHVVASFLNNAEIRLYNMNGQLVLKYKTSQFDEQISAAGLSSGLYFFTINEDGQTVQKGKLLIY